MTRCNNCGHEEDAHTWTMNGIPNSCIEFVGDGVPCECNTFAATPDAAEAGQSETIKRMESICAEFDARVGMVGLSFARLELAKRFAETEADLSDSTAQLVLDNETINELRAKLAAAEDHQWRDGTDGTLYHCSRCGISKSNDHDGYSCAGWLKRRLAAAEGDRDGWREVAEVSKQVSQEAHDDYGRVMDQRNELRAKLTAAEAERDAWQRSAENSEWPFEWVVATALKEERDSLKAQLIDTQSALSAAHSEAAAEGIRAGVAEAKLSEHMATASMEADQFNAGYKAGESREDSDLARSIYFAEHPEPDQDVFDIGYTWAKYGRRAKDVESDLTEARAELGRVKDEVIEQAAKACDEYATILTRDNDRVPDAYYDDWIAHNCAIRILALKESKPTILTDSLGRNVRRTEQGDENYPTGDKK